MKDEEKIKQKAAAILKAEQSKDFIAIENIVNNLSIEEIFQIDEYITKIFLTK